MAGNDLKLQVLLSAIDRVTGPMKKIMGGTSATAKALKAARDQLKDLDRAQREIQGFRKLKNDAQSSSLALKASQQQLAHLAVAVKGVDEPTQKAARAYAKAERETTKLTKAHMASLRAVRDARGALNAAGIAANKLGDHEQRLRSEMARTSLVIDKQQHKLTQLGKASQRAYLAKRNLAKSQSLAGAAASGGASIGAAATAVALPAVVSVKAYAQWEDAMLGVAKQVQGARDNTGKLTPLYYDLGNSIKEMATRIPMTTTEIAALIEAGARMGIQGKANLLAFAETTAITASAFELPVDQVGEDMGKLAGLYKIPIKSISTLGDTINWLDDNALSKGGDIIDVMRRLGGVADKLDFRKAAALGSTFLTLGATPEVAGSASNAMVRELSIATMQSKRFQTGIARLGLDAGALQKGMVKDATGTILMVMEAIKKLPEAEQLTVATRLFGKEFGDDASKLANNLGEYRRQLGLVNAAEAQGSMNREAAARLANLSSGWQLLKNDAFNVASEMGASLAPALKDVMTSVGNVLGGVRDWVKENPALAGGILKATAVIAGLLAAVAGITLSFAAVLGPMALVKFSLTTLGAGPAITKLASLGLSVLPMLGKAFMVLGRAMLMNPIGIVLTLVAGLAYLIWKNWSTIGPALAGMWESVKIYAGAAWDWMKAKADWLWQALKTIFAWTPLGMIVTNWGAIMGFLGGLWTKFKDMGTNLLQALKTIFAWTPLGMIVTNWGAIMGFLGGLWTKFKDIGANLLQGLVDGLLGGLAKVKETIVGVGSKVTGWFKEKLGINSPSRVFAQFGDYTMAGLAGGLDRSQGLPLRSLTAIAGNMRKLGAGIAIGATALPAMASPLAALPAVRIDSRAPIAPRAAASQVAGATYNITINAPAGGQAQDIAHLVRLELERIDRERAAKTRSRLGDYD